MLIVVVILRLSAAASDELNFLFDNESKCIGFEYYVLILCMSVLIGCSNNSRYRYRT